MPVLNGWLGGWHHTLGVLQFNTPIVWCRAPNVSCHIPNTPNMWCLQWMGYWGVWHHTLGVLQFNTPIVWCQIPVHPICDACNDWEFWCMASHIGCIEIQYTECVMKFNTSNMWCHAPNVWCQIPVQCGENTWRILQVAGLFLQKSHWLWDSFADNDPLK